MIGMSSSDRRVEESIGGARMLRLYVIASEALSKFKADTSGATAIEYGLLASGIPVAIIIAVALLGGEVSALYNTTATEVEGAL